MIFENKYPNNYGMDFVTYKALNVVKNESKEFKNVACYASHYSNMPQVAFELFPNKEKVDHIPMETFFHFCELCNQYGLFPDGCVWWTENSKNCLYIPPNVQRCQTYTALCCYRWTDSVGNLPHNLCRAVSEGHHFYQAFFWTCRNIQLSVGHSFHNTSNDGVYSRSDLREMFACERLFNREKETYKVLSSTGSVIQKVTKIAAELADASIPINKAEKFLDPLLTPMFSLPNKEFKKALKEFK